jgi:ketosteroid isomerase-like protein
MSRTNVEEFLRAIDAYNRGDIEAFLESAHPDVEWYPFSADVEGGEAYHGHEGVRRWWANLASYLDEFEASIDECRDLGGSLIAFGRVRMRFKSGVTLDMEIAWVARYRDGLWISGRTYRFRGEALKAVGLSE